MPSLNDEQKAVVKGLLQNKNKTLQTLGGYAGTGKTTVISFLIQQLPRWGVCAFTGKAANQLRRKGIVNASTIHSLIYKPKKEENGTVYFELKRPDELDVEGIICDEASMVSKLIDHDLQSFGVPIIYVGDHGQLEPVNSDHNLMANPEYKLEEIQRNAGEIAHFAELLRKGGNPYSFKTQGQVQIGPESVLNDEILMGTDQIICAYNKTRIDLNKKMRELRGYKKVLTAGEKVMCLKNNKLIGIFNGMQGTVQAINYKKHLFDFYANGERFNCIHYDPEQFGKEKVLDYKGPDGPNPFDYADAITCHKAQGDEWDNVIVYEQKCERWDHKRWAYTAASRAKNNLIWVAPKPFIPDWMKQF